MTTSLFAAVFDLRGRDDDPSSVGPRRGASVPHALPRSGDDTLENHDDQEIVERVRSGDVGVYEQLFRSYFTPLSDFAESMTGSSDTAEELVQGVLWNVWERRTEWSVRTSVRAYLFTAVRYQALNHKRNQRHRAHLLDRAARDAELGDVQGRSTSPARETELADLTMHLRRAIAALPLTRQHVLTLRWDYGLSYAEIGAIVGSSVKAVENQLNRTLKQLRGTLAHLADEFRNGQSGPR
jgi:RNA polymerase sigma-70 factor (ECF subfamily)